MWIRSAFWVGKPRVGFEKEFRSGVNEELVPALRRLPAVARARALWPRQLEDSPPDIACQVLVEFDSVDDLHLMLASPERRALRVRVGEIAGLFDGTLSHIDYEVG